MQPPCIQGGETPLPWAIQEGHRDCAELLLDRNADLHMQNNVARGEGREVPPMVVGAGACIVGV